MTFVVDRRVHRLDDTPDPELSYEVAVLAEGDKARRSQRMTAAERVLAVLPTGPGDGVTTQEIGDRVTTDVTGKGGLKPGTIRQALNRDLEGQVDAAGPPADRRWWRV